MKKKFALSKLNWLGILTALIGILGLTSTLELSAETMKVILFVSGGLTVILRTFYTSTSIASDTR